MTLSRRLAAAGLSIALLAGCSPSEPEPTPAATAEPATSATPSPTAEPAPEPEPEPEPTVEPQPTATVPLLSQPAIWPDSSVVFADPLSAAVDFVATVFDVAPTLGPYLPNDSVSGEVEVFAPTENGGTLLRSTLTLRQLGGQNGWFVTAASSAGNTITSPGAGDTIPDAPVQVDGEGRGFEANLVVQGRLQGAPQELDLVITSGGTFGTPAPYSVTVDVSAADPGDTVMLLVRGGVALEDDPGEFAAIPVVIN